MTEDNKNRQGQSTLSHVMTKHTVHEPKNRRTCTWWNSHGVVKVTHNMAYCNSRNYQNRKPKVKAKVKSTEQSAVEVFEVPAVLIFEASVRAEVNAKYKVSV